MNRTFGSSLVWRLCLLIMLSLAAFAYAGYHLVLQPAINELARAQMRGVAQKVQDKLETSFTGMEAGLRTSRNWGVITQAKPTAEFLPRFNDVFIPMLQHQPDISAIVFSDESGREILLVRTEAVVGSSWHRVAVRTRIIVGFVIVVVRFEIGRRPKQGQAGKNGNARERGFGKLLLPHGIVCIFTIAVT